MEAENETFVAAFVNPDGEKFIMEVLATRELLKNGASNTNELYGPNRLHRSKTASSKGSPQRVGSTGWLNGSVVTDHWSPKAFVVTNSICCQSMPVND